MATTLKTRVEKLEQAANLGEPPENIMALVRTFGGTPSDYMIDGRWVTLEELVAGSFDEPDTAEGNRAP